MNKYIYGINFTSEIKEYKKLCRGKSKNIKITCSGGTAY